MWKVNLEDRRGFRYKHKHTHMYRMLSEIWFIFKLEFWFRALGVSGQREERENATIKLTPVSWGSPRCRHTTFSPAANVFYRRILTALFFSVSKNLPFFALHAGMDYILVSPPTLLKCICWSPTPTPRPVWWYQEVEIWGGDYRVQPSWMEFSFLIKETPKSISPSFPCCEDTMKGQKCAALKRMLTRTQSCWHPDLVF